jgi:hypothetical protein
MSGTNSLIEALKWAADHGTTFEVIEQDGAFAIRANLGRVSAEYVIDLAEPAGLTGAIWAAISSVEAGTEYHRVHGFAPGLDSGTKPYGA